MVQLTRFSCGGVVLGIALNHNVFDGYGFAHMTNSWARLSRGIELEFMPVHDRAGCLSPSNTPQVMFQHLEYDPPKVPLSGDFALSVGHGEDTSTQSLLRLTKDQVDALTQNASSMNVKLSTFEVLAGHTWRTVCKALGLDDDQEVRVYLLTNGRSRLKNSALPKWYIGNVIFYLPCIAKSGDITRNPLWYAANAIHETMEKGKNEAYLRSSIDYLETHPDLASVLRGQQSLRSTNLEINSWEILPLHEADFGWGRPSLVGHGGISRDNRSVITENANGDGGFSLSIRLLTCYMVLFEKYFYDFEIGKLISCI